MLSKKAEKRSSRPIYPAIIQFAWRSSNVQWDQEQDHSRSIFHSSLHFSIQWFPLRPRPLDSTRFTDLPTLPLVVILLGFKQRTYLPTVSHLISMDSVVEFDGAEVMLCKFLIHIFLWWLLFSWYDWINNVPLILIGQNLILSFFGNSLTTRNYGAFARHYNPHLIRNRSRILMIKSDAMKIVPNTVVYYYRIRYDFHCISLYIKTEFSEKTP